MNEEHKALIVEFEKFKVRQCACKDYECSHALGQEIGPRIAQVMSGADKLPTLVQAKLGGILTKMTECAKATKPAEPAPAEAAPAEPAPAEDAPAEPAPAEAAPAAPAE
jgi:hypothetical protein